MNIRNLHPVWFGLILSCCWAAPSSWALDSSYGPFPLGHSPRPFAMERCEEWSHVERTAVEKRFEEWILGIPADKAHSQVHIRFVDYYDRDSTCEILDGNGKLLVAENAVSDGRFFGATTADLNHDGRADFVIETTYDGCGLACWNRTLVFVISKGDKYVIQSIFTMFREECDLADIDNDGRCEMIHTAVLGTEEKDERDGKHHEYWVFHRLDIVDGRFVVSTRDKRFPKWVWYTFKPNQKETKRISREVKDRLWKENGGDASIFWKPDSDNPAPQSQPS